MASRRVLKAAEAIREVVGMSILRDIQDPRVSDVTVTYVEVSGDMQLAKVHVSVMGTEAKQQLCLRGLQNAAGFFQRKIGDRIQTRYTPRVQFLLDKGVKHSIQIAKILKEVLPSDAPRETVIGELDATEGSGESVETAETVETVDRERNNE
ncbi:MAG: 30S ribosome-binding factor RbfA [Planctomycetia bacterium]|nr:30S ribosome-binding factor RbfA [Planctomycetia bacterium]